MGRSKIDKKYSILLFTATFIAYVIISMTKSAYAAAMVSIIDQGLLTKENSGIINASFYLFYGILQLVAVKVLDKVSPLLMVFVSLSGTFVCLFGMAFSKTFLVMLILWSLCGIVQFSVWPAIIRIISEYILPEHRDRAMVYISFSYCIGMLINYLIAALVLKVSKWQTLFIVSGLIVLAAIVMWCVIVNKTKHICKSNTNELEYKPIDKEYERKNISFIKLALLTGVPFLSVATFIRSGLDAGLKLWVPTMITENYSVSPSFASMLTTVLVFINLGGIFIAGFIYPKRTKNPVFAFSVCFLIALPFTCLLLLTGKASVIWVVLFLAAITTMMYCAHQLINIIIPTFFARYNKAGAMTGVLNAFASFGIVCSNIGFGWIAEHFGWHTTIVSWIILTCVAFVLCLFAVQIWKRFFKNN